MQGKAFQYMGGAVPGLWYCPLPGGTGYSKSLGGSELLTDALVRNAARAGIIRPIGGDTWKVVGPAAAWLALAGMGQVSA